MTLQLVLFLLLTVKCNKTLNFNHNINHITHLQDYSNFETLGTKHQLNLNSVCCTWAPIAGNSLSHGYLLSILTTLLNNTTNKSTNHLKIICFQQFLGYLRNWWHVWAIAMLVWFVKDRSFELCKNECLCCSSIRLNYMWINNKIVLNWTEVKLS